MKTTVSRVALLRALRIIAPFLGNSKHDRAVWFTACKNGLRLEAGSLLADLYISHTIFAETEICGDAPVGLLFDSLLPVARAADGMLGLETARYDGQGVDMVKLNLGFGVANLECVDPAWHACKQGEISNFCQLDNLQGLRRAIATVIDSVSDDTESESIACLRIKAHEGRVFADGMNGHQYQRALIATGGALLDILPDSGILLRKDIARRLIPLLNPVFFGEQVLCAIEFKKSLCNEGIRPFLLHFKGQAGSMRVPLVNYTYPNTESFCTRARDGRSTIRIQARELQKVLGLFAAIGTSYDRGVILNLASTLVFEWNQALGYLEGVSGQAELQVEYKGELKRIAFPARDLLDLISQFAVNEEVCLRMTSVDGPCLITGSKHPGLETIIMPMRLFENSNGGSDV